MGALRLRAAARHRTVPEAFTLYDTPRAGVCRKGIRSLIILNQETVWGTAPGTTAIGPATVASRRRCANYRQALRRVRRSGCLPNLE